MIQKIVLAASAMVSMLSCGGVRDTTLQVTKFITPQATTEACVFDSSAAQSDRQFIDIAAGRAMLIGLVVRNNLEQNARNLNVNSNDAEMDEFEITVTKITSTPAGANVGKLPLTAMVTRPTKFQIAASGDQAGSVIAWDVADGEKIELTDPTKPGELLLTVKGRAHLLDGTVVESNDASTLITICQSCSSCPTGEIRRSPCGPGFEGVSGAFTCVKP